MIAKESSVIKQLEECVNVLQIKTTSQDLHIKVLELQVQELQMSKWQKLKRWFKIKFKEKK